MGIYQRVKRDKDGKTKRDDNGNPLIVGWYYDFIYKRQRYVGCIGRVSRSLAKQTEARMRAAAIEHRLNPATARKSPRFDAFAEHYLGWVKTNTKPLTYVKAVAMMKRLNATFGKKDLSDITAWQIEQFKKALKDDDYAPATINHHLAFLRAMLNKAITWKKLSENPCKEVKALKVVNERTRFLTEEEEDKLLAACSPSLRRVAEAGLLSGFRARELTSLRPQDVDLGRALASVAACYAKNGESRTIPIGERLTAIIQEALATRENAPIAFTAENGQPWKPANFSTRLRNASSKAGIEPCGPHTLRHTFASRLIMAGVDLNTLKELLGHKDIKMTLRYTHLSPDHKRNTIATLEQQFSGTVPQPLPQQPTPLPSSIGGKVTALRSGSGL